MNRLNQQPALRPMLWPAGIVLIAMFAFAKVPTPWWFLALVYAAAMPFIAGDALTFVTGGLLAFTFWISSTQLLLDLTIVAAMSALAIFLRAKLLSRIVRRSRALPEANPHFQRRFLDLGIPLGFVLSVSLALSASYHAREKGLIVRGSSPQPEARKGHVGVALSGGGYRATLFHAGVIKGLQTFHIPITSIASVSGGSIAASAYAEGIAPETLVQSIINDRFNLFRKLLNIESIWGYTFVLPGTSRLRAQAGLLDETILAGDKFARFRGRSPNLMVIVSDLTDGRAIGITPEGVLSRSTFEPPEPTSLYKNARSVDLRELPSELKAVATWAPTNPSDWPGIERTSMLVAASGAYPGAFEPFSLLYEDFVDGGVTDNSALTLLLDADFFARNCQYNGFSGLIRWRQDVVIASDASRHYVPAGRYGPISAPLRAIETAFARVSPKPLYATPPISSAEKPEADRLAFLPPSTFLLSPGNLVSADQSSMDSRRVRYLLQQMEDRSDNRGKEALQRIRSLLAQPVEKTFAVMERWRAPSDTIRDDGTNANISLDEIKSEIERDVLTFNRSPTLTAKYTSEDALRIFRLGWLLVAVESAAMVDSMQGSAIGSAPAGFGRNATSLCPEWCAVVSGNKTCR